MSYLPDEQWAMIEDSIEKKNVARSSHNRRSHCGKGGSVKFPSDYMTKKELKAMNGEVKSYRMNDSMSWEEFKKLPDDIKVIYVKSLREKYKVPDNVIAKAMGTTGPSFSKLVRRLKIGLGKEAGGAGRRWHNSEDATKFWNWWGGVKEVKNSEDDKEVDSHVEPSIDIFDEEISEYKENRDKVPAETDSLRNACTPISGRLDFSCNANEANEALDAVRAILGDVDVHIHIEWTTKYHK